MFHDYVRSL